jgi:hypothetical protein
VVVVAELPAAFVDEVVVVPAQLDQVRQFGRAAVGPVPDVVGFDVAPFVATRPLARAT